MNQYRENHWEYISTFGLPINLALPEIEKTEIKIRDSIEVRNRSIALSGVIYASMGLSGTQVLEWLRSEELESFITEKEVSFLKGQYLDASYFRYRVEALWALIWCLDLISELDHTSPCGNNLAIFFPKIQAGESSNQFLLNSNLRLDDKIIKQLDLLYCINWSVNEKILRGDDTTPFLDYIIKERRWALEWVTHKDVIWEGVTLDT